jgi:U3 small nucleolar RNA-associated protein 12
LQLLTSPEMRAAPDAVSTTREISFPGHREAIRHVEVSADDSLVLSLSSESLRMWNAQSLACVRAIGVSQGVVVRFLAGNRFALVATKTGELVLIDLHSTTELCRVSVSDHSVNALERVSPDSDIFCTVGADKSIRSWSVSESGIVQDEEKTATLADEGLCMAVGTEKVAVGMLDSTLQLFHSDTLNPHLTLYGHKLPVTCVQFVTDGSLVVSGSADKSVKVWSPKFGNCLKSFKAHDGTVSRLALVPGGSHMLFSTGRDGQLALWDLDRPDPLVFQATDAHRGEAWALALASDGAFAITGGADRALRKWARSEEQLFAEEERERREELQNERELADADAAVVVARPSRKTVQSVRTADRLLELLPTDESTPIQAAKLLTMIPPADLPEVLLAIPAASARLLLSGLADILESVPTGAVSLIPVDTLLSAGFTLVQAQARYLVAEPGIAPLLARLRTICHELVSHRRKRCGVTAAAASFQLAQAQKKRKRT